MITYFFIFLAVLAIASALAMVISKNTVNSALFLVLNMVALAGLFLLLKAQFLAVVQILVYAGAIMVLFLFVIMLLNVQDEENLFSKFRVKYFVAFLVGIVVFSQLLYSIGSFTEVLPEVSPEMTEAGTVEAVGEVLYSQYLLPFHIIALLLTAAVNGALMIAQHKIKSGVTND
ncbi:MAG: NADH-quinone oxidoreductase subunit J [Aliifodinibius sp.]|nr:NADH-quinone oxidoreductase subunit J [Candidatus Bathyarchaeota archaeon]NIT54988.1 NADH-quinone oxidoreductase subunit J [Fodinibius sp.]NIV10009.1 NADH-quinone oxidoreductase subunit J [Fodinibius sp.]NIY23572.1 NADH-quinone oxidoreductase subunit J [Fodinibius sp.]